MLFPNDVGEDLLIVVRELSLKFILAINGCRMISLSTWRFIIEMKVDALYSW